MAIIGSEVKYLTFTVSLLGEKAVTLLKYFTDDSDVVPSLDFLIAWQAANQANLLALMSGIARLEKIHVRSLGPYGDDEATVFPAAIGTSGIGVTNTLPPHVALGFRKLPDNDLIEGANLTPFRPGSFRIMGQSETWQDGGVWNSTLGPLASDFAAGVREFTVNMGGGDNRIYQLYMDRPPLTEGGPPDSVAPVETLSRAVYVTSQNTRKLR